DGGQILADEVGCEPATVIRQLGTIPVLERSGKCVTIHTLFGVLALTLSLIDDRFSRFGTGRHPASSKE
ncbi:MAG: hypothetical protein ACC652_07570, partial [Acidimicrobiales bacterium]